MNLQKAYSWYECCHKMRSGAKDALDHKRDGQLELASLAVASVREWTHRADWAWDHDGECVLSDYEAAKS